MAISKTGEARRLRILAIDDEALVLRLMQRVLSGTYDIVAVGSGAAAMDAIAAQDGAFDAVICDVRMPVMNGLDLHDVVAARWPSLADRFVFATGGLDTLRGRLDKSGRPCIDKPFEPETLRRAIRAIAALE